MHYDLMMFFIFVGVGLTTQRLTWRGWSFLAVAIFAWMMYNWLRSMSGPG